MWYLLPPPPQLSITAFPALTDGSLESAVLWRWEGLLTSVPIISVAFSCQTYVQQRVLPGMGQRVLLGMGQRVLLGMGQRDLLGNGLKCYQRELAVVACVSEESLR